MNENNDNFGTNEPTGAMPSSSASQPSAQVPTQPSPQPAAQSYAPPAGAPVRPAAEVSNPAHSHAQPAYSVGAGAAHGAPAAAKSGSSMGKTFLIAFAGALVACVLAFGIMLATGFIGGKGAGVNLGAAQSTSIEAADEEASLAEAVANKCLPSVVSIDVFAKQSASSGNSIFDYLYGFDSYDSGELTETGLGSGVILSDDGYIVTNYHVIEGGEQFKVTIEGETYEAELVGSEASSDVAVLKVKDGKDFKAIELGDSDNIKVGEWVMSLGSPFGLEQSVATGIVSATSRSQVMSSQSDGYGSSSGEPTIYPNMIQTDAAINPGNSGGALVNADGELIGINTLITSYSGNYSGVGFAIPANYAINLAQSIISGEEPTHAQLGITMTTVNESIAKRYGFPTDSGAYVSSVAEGSAAANAGMQVGDIIISFDGKEISSASDVMLAVRTKNPGDNVTVTVNRDGQTQDLQVTLGQSKNAPEQEGQNQQQSSPSQGNGSGSGSILDLFQ